MGVTVTERCVNADGIKRIIRLVAGISHSSVFSRTHSTQKIKPTLKQHHHAIPSKSNHKFSVQYFKRHRSIVKHFAIMIYVLPILLRLFFFISRVSEYCGYTIIQYYTHNYYIIHCRRIYKQHIISYFTIVYNSNICFGTI